MTHYLRGIRNYGGCFIAALYWPSSGRMPLKDWWR